MRAGGPENVEVGVEDLRPLKAGEALVRVEAVGLNHAETLMRHGNYVVRATFPWATGGEGSGTVVDAGDRRARCQPALACAGEPLPVRALIL
jgi:NADPH2:quinone reductase